jgi:hypothetical protein
MLNQFCKLRAIKENERVRGREKIIPPVKEKKILRRIVVGFHPFTNSFSCVHTPANEM